ncbi:hypothetical protein [Salinimonas lutimaris]|uniref:hypothetical protein n=1 Tax=Salinimonas lutimaris TaxID=914153 RepID=UPI0010BF8770|nr:hypothetical protein [Salinimonas lutimaris]
MMTVHPFYPLLKIASRSGMVAALWVLLFAAGHSASHTATGYTDQRPVSSLAWAYSGGVSENRSRLVLPESLSGADQDPAILPGLFRSGFSLFVLWCKELQRSGSLSATARLRPEPRAPPALLIFR